MTPQSQCGISPCSIRFWLLLLLCCLGFRIGEAQVPGPSSDSAQCPPNPSSTWTLGICNPSGLSGKGTLLTSLGADVYAVSETHFSKEATAGFASSLRALRSPLRHVLPGAPMAHRSTASSVGAWAGVAFVSAVPSRTVSTPWPPDLFETGRMQFGSFFVDHRWIVGGVIYGWPECHNHPQARQRTIEALDFACQHILLQKGPRFLCGDWNFEPQDLAVTTVLQQAGWVEVQDLFAALTGVAVRVTCKNTSRKDVLWLSPELARSFDSLTLDSETFADHAVMLAQFRRSKVAAVQYLWPTPKPIPWKRVPPADHSVDFSQGDPTELLATLWKDREAAARAALGSEWRHDMSGRCQQTEPKAVKSIVVPLKQSRKSEIQPTFYGFHMQHCRWFKQLRRLQNYCVWVRDRDVTDVQGSVHGIGLWRSILNSPGFSGGFASWWPSRNYKCPNDPVVMPSHVPRYEVAVQIFDAFRCEVRLLETRLQAAHKQRRRDLRARDPKLLFRDVKRQPPQPVETLVQASSCHVVSVDLDFHGLVVDSLPCFDVQRPVVIQGRSHELIAHDTDTIWVDDATQVRPGDRVVQSKYVGELPALFEAFHEQWRKRWCRHDLVPTSQWQQLLDFARRTFPGVHVRPFLGGC